MTATIPVDDLKATREALCLAQAALMLLSEADARAASLHAVLHLQPLIDEIDRHRPLWPDGKHGELHTETCGCDR